MLRNFRLLALRKSRRSVSTTGVQFQKSEAKEETKDEKSTNASQINIYEQKSGLIEGSKIEYFMKKKEIGMTDDESTIKGKAKAKAKDFTALIFTGVAGVALSYALYTLYKQYFAKRPADYAFEIAQKYVKNNAEIEDQLGEYKIDTRDSKGHRRWGEDQVISSQIQAIPDKGLEVMKINFFLTTSNRKCLVHAMMVRAEGETDDAWFPMQIFGEIDYDQKFMVKQILFVDYSKEIKEGISLEILRQNAAEEQENIADARESYKSGALTDSKDKISNNLSTTSEAPLASSVDDSHRARPKW